MENQIIDIAHKVRKWAENRQKKYPRDYDKDLAGMCAKANCKLHDVLKAVGIKTEIVINSEHCFLLYNDYVLDVTATQFGYTKEVFYKVYTKLENESFWEKEFIFQSSEEVAKHQKRHDWPREQLARKL